MLMTLNGYSGSGDGVLITPCDKKKIVVALSGEKKKDLTFTGNKAALLILIRSWMSGPECELLKLQKKKNKIWRHPYIWLWLLDITSAHVFTPTRFLSLSHTHTRVCAACSTSAFITSLSSICASCYDINYLMEPDKQSARLQTRQKGLLVLTYTANTQLVVLSINRALNYRISFQTLSNLIFCMFSANAGNASDFGNVCYKIDNNVGSIDDHSWGNVGDFIC